MTETMYYLSKLLPYIVLFPVFAVMLLALLYLLFKKGMNNNNVSLYGLFLGFSKKDILSLALVFIQYIVIIETLFLKELSFYSILFIFTPILMYGIINLEFSNMIMNIISSLFLLVLCFFERTFLSYFLDINSVWYIFFLFLAVCIFIIILDTYLLMRNINNLTVNRINKEKKLKNNGGIYGKS
jgi:hypothetical protein